MAEPVTSLQEQQPSRLKKLIIPVALVLFGLYASTHMVAAGDTWVALACGRHFANHGVDTVEPFSFNSHPAGPTDEQLADYSPWMRSLIRFWHPTGWINQNWLAHLTFYDLVKWFGGDGTYDYNALVYWKYALFTATIVVVFALGRVLGAGDFLSLTAACFAMVVGRSFYDIRPACYSNLLVPLFVLLLAIATYKHYKYIWLMIPLIVFWANVHGGYIYAYIMLTPFMAVHILLNLPRRWSVALGLSGLWLVLYLVYYKFQTNNYTLEIARFWNPDHVKMSFLNGMLYAALLLGAVSCAMAAMRSVPTGLFYSYNVVTSLAYPVVLMIGFFLRVPSNINPQYGRIVDHFMKSNIVGFLVLFVLGSLIVVALAVSKNRFVRISNRTIAHIMAAGGLSFIAMILFNPFHLTNLTHTFEISISEHAASWRSVNEWRPAFDWMDPTTDRPNPVGDEEGFAVMLIVAVVAVLGWLFLQMTKPALRPVRKGPRQASLPTSPPDSAWPKIDLAIIMVGALTIYMAFRSRRFIAIAAPSAAPVLAMLIRQIWQMATAKITWKKSQLLEPFSLPVCWQKRAWLAAAAVVLGLGLYWGVKYYRIYLGPWPRDDVRDSVFMRMTDSHQKPFEVCDFINDNKLTGRIFNYWTEGGGLVFGQTPDPETGRTPLQHFMDGRAQAAFNHDTFKKWQHIYAGGPIAEKIILSGKTPNAMEYRQIGEWLDKELKSYKVWVVLMPKSESDSTFMRSLMTTGIWQTAFIDEMQHLVVDTQSEQGKQLIADILNDRAVFPNEFSKYLTLVRLVFETNDPRHVSRIFEYANAAFQARQYPSAMIALMQVGRIPGFQDKVTQAIRAYIEKFRTERNALMQKSGFIPHLASAMLGARFLASSNPPDKEDLDALAKSLEQQSRQISERSIW